MPKDVSHIWSNVVVVRLGILAAVACLLIPATVLAVSNSVEIDDQLHDYSVYGTQVWLPVDAIDMTHVSYSSTMTRLTVVDTNRVGWEDALFQHDSNYTGFFWSTFAIWNTSDVVYFVAEKVVQTSQPSKAWFSSAVVHRIGVNFTVLRNTTLLDSHGVSWYYEALPMPPTVLAKTELFGCASLDKCETLDRVVNAIDVAPDDPNGIQTPTLPVWWDDVPLPMLR